MPPSLRFNSVRELDRIIAATGYKITHFQTGWGKPLAGDVVLAAYEDCSVIQIRSNLSITGTGLRDLTKTTFAFNVGKGTVYWKDTPVMPHSIAGFNLRDKWSHYRLSQSSALAAVFFKRPAVLGVVNRLVEEDPSWGMSVLETLEGCNHIDCKPQHIDWLREIITKRIRGEVVQDPKALGDPLLAAVMCLKNAVYRNPCMLPAQAQAKVMDRIRAVVADVSEGSDRWETPSVDGFCSMCQYGSSIVNEACQALFRMPAQKLLTGHRMENAIELLSNPVLANQVGCGGSVRQVADFLQITPKTLCKNMQAYRGQTPIEVRQASNSQSSLLAA